MFQEINHQTKSYQKAQSVVSSNGDGATAPARRETSPVASR